MIQVYFRRIVPHPFHPSREGRLPMGAALAVQISVKDDDVDVELKHVETTLHQQLLLLGCLRLLHLRGSGQTRSLFIVIMILILCTALHVQCAFTIVCI